MVKEHHEVVTETGEDLRVLDLRLPRKTADPVADWLIDDVAAVIAWLREGLERTDREPRRLAIVVHQEAHDDVWHTAIAAAACEAVRGVVGAVTLEMGPRARLNVVLTGQRGLAEPGDTFKLLASDDGAFFAGSTFDLRQQP